MTTKLSSNFLAPYRQAGDCFPNLLARSVYLSKYCRDNETWTDTILRVVNGNCALDSSVQEQEREKLFHIMWTMQGLPAGRGLWTGGVEGIPPEARFSCWFTTLYHYRDWGWIADQLMLGGGVGVSLLKISQLPLVELDGHQPAQLLLVCDSKHPNHDDVLPSAYGRASCNGVIVATYSSITAYTVEDSREGWVKALELVLEYSFNNKALILDLSLIRERGKLLKTFGGIACGPGPLATMLRAVWNVVRSAQGRHLDSVDGLDITNHIGICIKSGNVRRSALLVMGDPNDEAFRNAKKNHDALLSHRQTSNNAITFERFEQFKRFDWGQLARDNSEGDGGDPGTLNLALGRLTDPGVMGCNPCAEALLFDKESCNLAEVFPANAKGNVEETLRLITRYCLRQRLTVLKDPTAQAVSEQNMRIGVGLGGVCDFDWTEEQLHNYFEIVRKEADDYAQQLDVARPRTTTVLKPSGTISLLCGSSPGLRAPHAPYFVRRTRHATNDPMTEALKLAGVPFEQDIYDNTGNTLVFSFPMKARHTKYTVETETIKDQFERQLAVQNNWADNAVSNTLAFRKDEIDQLASCMEHYVPLLKSTSYLPKEHSFAQAPYETIDEDTFSGMSKDINLDHPLVQGDFEVDECESGICPIK